MDWHGTAIGTARGWCVHEALCSRRTRLLHFERARRFVNGGTRTAHKISESSSRAYKSCTHDGMDEEGIMEATTTTRTRVQLDHVQDDVSQGGVQALQLGGRVQLATPVLQQLQRRR